LFVETIAVKKLISGYKSQMKSLLALAEDLSPPLGYPGGPCHVVRRIQQSSLSTKEKDRLAQEVEDGEDLPNVDAAKVYPVEVEKLLANTAFGLKELVVTAHVGYRMDLRGITIPQIRVVIQTFAQEWSKLKSQKHPIAQRWEEAMAHGEPIEYHEKKQNIFAVFTVAGKSVKLITAYYKGEKEEEAPEGGCKLASEAELQLSMNQLLEEVNLTYPRLVQVLREHYADIRKLKGESITVLRELPYLFLKAPDVPWIYRGITNLSAQQVEEILQQKVKLGLSSVSYMTQGERDVSWAIMPTPALQFAQNMHFGGMKPDTYGMIFLARNQGQFLLNPGLIAQIPEIRDWRVAKWKTTVGDAILTEAEVVTEQAIPVEAVVVVKAETPADTIRKWLDQQTRVAAG
jgi:hypothetical protein